MVSKNPAKKNNPTAKKNNPTVSIVRPWKARKNHPKPLFGRLRQIVTRRNNSRIRRVHAHLDFENMEIPDELDALQLADNIRTALSNVHPDLKLQRVYAAGNRFLFKPNAELHRHQFNENRVSGVNPYFEALEWTGVTVCAIPLRRYTCITCPPQKKSTTSSGRFDIDPQDSFSRVKDLADACLVREMIGLPLSFPPPDYVFLMSGDQDFASTLKWLHERNYTIFLAEKGFPKWRLRPYVKLVWDWSDLIKGKPPSLARY